MFETQKSNNKKVTTLEGKQLIQYYCLLIIMLLFYKLL